jgi:hypothetical protein
MGLIRTLCPVGTLPSPTSQCIHVLPAYRGVNAVRRRSVYAFKLTAAVFIAIVSDEACGRVVAVLKGSNSVTSKQPSAD